MSALINALRAVPAIVNLINKFIDMWLDYQDERDEKEIRNLEIKRKSLLAAIRNESISYDDRLQLRRLLWDLNKR